MGAQRWIPIGPFNLQPSEFGRIVVALILAMYFGENRRGARNTGDLVIGGIFTAVPLLLIAKQPDLGTAVTLHPGLPRRRLPRRACACGCSASSRSPACSLAPVAWKFALKDYQRSRIETFLDPGTGSRGRGLPDRSRPASPSAPAA